MPPDALPENVGHLSMESDEKNTPDIHVMHSAVMREMADPTDGFEPTPVWLLLLYFVIAASAGWYLALYSGAFRPEIYDEQPAAAYGGLSKQKMAPVDPMVLGKRTFNYCIQCHQETGLGVADTYPPLAGSEWVQGQPEILVRILLYGLNGNVTVRGHTYNREMPNWGTTLNDEKMAAVLTYVRSSWGNHASSVSPELVSEIRKATAGRGGHWTEAELKAISKELAAKASPAKAK